MADQTETITLDTLEADGSFGAFGANAWLVEEKYEEYLRDPEAVGPSWREFFEDYRPRRSIQAPVVQGPATQVAGGQAPVVQGPATEVAGGQAPPAQVGQPEDRSVQSGDGMGDLPVALRGAAGRIAANMTASLTVPTATSIRPVPAKLLEVNRALLNKHLSRTLGGKVSFTHLVGYAVVRALGEVPALNASYVDDVDGTGTPGVVRHRHVGLGIAVDVERPDGSHSLLVPCIRDADTMDFHQFVMSYEDLVRKVRTNKVSGDDLAGVTVTLTNPGTLGTVGSVPRLMAGQGAIVATGAIGYPPELQAADPEVLAQMGVSKTITLTCTYDHRIVQGAESGAFLGVVHELLLGERGFYDEVFSAMGAPLRPTRWTRDINPAPGSEEAALKQAHVSNLVNMYRVRGHLIAHLDPLAEKPPPVHPELDPESYGLTVWDLDRRFLVEGPTGPRLATLGETLDVLRDAYCHTVGIEYMHIQDPAQKRWIQRMVEGVPTTLASDEQLRILDRLNAAEAFERFLHTRYIGQKRFGLEGGESAIVILDSILDAAASSGLEECVLGMAHRGRLNVMVNIVGKSYEEMFAEFEGNLDPQSVQGSGDVKYHKGCRGVFKGLSGASIEVELAANPSHLEAVDPVVEGIARAHQDVIRRSSASAQPTGEDFAVGKVMAVLVHGDAAFAGQGVVAETLNLSALKGYRTGGTVHLVINNQVGFTTDPASGRSSVYPTDVAKMVQAPIFHVNGDDPEACARVGRLAFEFRQEFHRDVVIDMVCYRRYGHNEGDEPSYTQPQMYERIDRHRSVRKLYTETLVRRRDLTMEEAERSLEDFQNKLQAALDATRASAPPALSSLPSPPEPSPAPELATGVPGQVLEALASHLSRVPDGFTAHPKLLGQLEARSKLFAEGSVDWGLAEAMALGSLLLEGRDVRLAGQDTRRGTFSHRHAVLVDYRTGEEYTPLGALGPIAESLGRQDPLGRFFVFDSSLSEFAALGFEYGYSVGHPDALVAWEAQFGDFVNGAQTIVDEFIASASEKWDQESSLVLLLPHGYEGQGPDHSSARLERFLELAAGGNLWVVYPTSAAQIFHLLRAQALRAEAGWRRPLVVMSPKSLLRARAARSPSGELETGGFRTVIDDPGLSAVPEASVEVQRLVLTAGKIAYEALERRAAGDRSFAVVRVEQLYPWPEEEIGAILERYGSAREVVWLQDEPENMGAWNFVHSRLHSMVGRDRSLRHVARRASGSPATGSVALHALEEKDLLDRALSGR